MVASSQGFAPSVIDQFTSGTAGSVLASSVAVTTVTVVLSSAGASNLGEIDAASITGATTTLTTLFAQVGLQSGGAPVAFGFGRTDGTGGGFVNVYNIAAANANVYRLSVFDPLTNLSTSVPVAATLTAGTPLNVALGFTGGQPPNTSAGQASSSAGGLSVDGLVTDTASNPIPGVQINVDGRYKDSFNNQQDDYRGMPTDQNGRFQLYNLVAGATYYVSLYGGCNQSGCYQGVPSGSPGGSTLGPNDFFYPSTATIESPHIFLQSIAGSSSTAISVYVEDQFNNVFPQAGVGLWPDWTNWDTNGGVSCSTSPIPPKQNPGLANMNVFASTGYVTLKGMPSGNYQLSAFTPYGAANFNAGADQQFNFQGCSSSDTDDVRLTIDTTSATPISLYDVYGNALAVNLTSVTIHVRMSTSSTGLVQGTLTFPSQVDLSNSPIVLVLNPNCQGNNQPCTGGGFESFASSATPKSVSYSIPVSSGQAYWMNVITNYWGPVFAGGNQPQPDLTSTGTATVNISFQPAGRILGRLLKPDGSVYVPPPNQQGGVNVFARGNNSWGNAQLNADGSFVLGGLLPGIYTFGVQNNGGGSFPFAIKQPAVKIPVVANQDTNQDAQLVSAITVQPQVDTTTLPAMSIYGPCPPNHSNGACPPEYWETLALPQGTRFTPDFVDGLLGGGPGDTPGAFQYSPSTGNATNCDGGGVNLASPGFCLKALPATPAGSSYDFYVLRRGDFDSKKYAGGVRPYFVVEIASTNVVVPQDTTAGVPIITPGSTTTYRAVALTPSSSLAGTPQAVLTGTVTVTNLITKQQFDQLGGDFQKFIQFLPMVWVYDSSGSLKAVGMVVPYPPSEDPLDAQLSQAVANDDYAAFQNLAKPGGWGPVGYEIRGLTANKTYSLVVTTPNYPPYKTSVTLGALGTTTYLDVDLDAHPGADMSGVVESTSAAAIAGAQVTVKASGYQTKTLTTDSSGGWSVDGLPAGVYEVSVYAAGYVAQTADVSVGDSGVVSVPTFSLFAANATISGTVYTNTPICPAGSTSCAAFGKTVLSGAKVLAYDDTQNLLSPSSALTLFRAVTDSSGAYRLDGLQAGETYKVFVQVDGYYVTNQSTPAVSGTLSGFDFALKPKPLDVDVFGHPVGPNYEFRITNYQQFSGGNVWYGLSPFDKAVSTAVTNSVTRPDEQGVPQLFMDIPLSDLTSSGTYVFHVEAQPNDPRAPLVVKEVEFGRNLPHNTCQSVDETLLGDASDVNSQGLPSNTASLDISGGTGVNDSGLTLPAGAAIPVLSTAIPSMCMTETAASASPQATALAASNGGSVASFASGVYQVTMSSVNYTQKGINLTLSYDQSGTSLDDLAIYTYNTSAGQWQSVPGLQTIDPVKGTISVTGLKTLSSVLSVGGRAGLMALSTGQGYRPTGTSTTDTALFAVLKPSTMTKGTFSGTTVKVYNFPNPFDLSSKTLQPAGTGANACGGLLSAITTSGTVIKLEVPSSVSGDGEIKIYTTSGRLVREIGVGALGGGECLYTTWDGHNSNGQAVANGVYYGVLSVGGSKVKDSVFKMAVIK
ncbi:MAG: carboxypeptidase regulatory-like domain-containing protein [Elusimicrobia bacterium]|nr:carboxypeptidase regulatory-like domain-containing protein [Elusimicrobiota bacterium]